MAHDIDTEKEYEEAKPFVKEANEQNLIIWNGC